jgi:hypothetical protein
LDIRGQCQNPRGKFIVWSESSKICTYVALHSTTINTRSESY